MKIIVAVLLLSSFSWAGKKSNLGSCTMVGNNMVCGNHLATDKEYSDWLDAYHQGTLPKPKPVTMYQPSTPVRQANGRIARSPKAKASFMSQQPCPSTGRVWGKCPGYVVDHVTPLVCGGVDAPMNMQWQTIADGKAKDKWERKACGK